MTSTRQQRVATLKHIFMLFDNDEDAPIFLCFAYHNFRSVTDIISYDPTMLDALRYLPAPSLPDSKQDQDLFKQPSPIKDKPLPLDPQYQVQMKIFQGIVTTLFTIGKPFVNLNLFLLSPSPTPRT